MATERAERPARASEGPARVESARNLRIQRDDLQRKVRELEQNVKAFRGVLEAMADPVMMLDLDGRVRMWNAAAEAFLGWRAGEVIGEVLPQVPERARTGTITDLRRIASLGDTQVREPTWLRRDGSHITADIRAVPVADADGLPFAVIVMVRELTADSRVDRMREDFVGLVSQELKNPLTAIVGFVQILDRPEVLDDPAKRTRTLRALDTRSRQLALLVDDLMLAAQVERGDLRLEREPTDIAGLVTEAVSRFEHFQPGRRFAIDVDTRLSFVDVDPRRIEQALAGMLSNAVKYSDVGDRIKVGVVRDRDNAVITVADRGSGIPPEALDRIFDRFYRAPAEGVPVTGLGLGLFLVKAIAEAHGGSVDAVSKRGKGTTFTLRIPLAVS